MIDFDVVVNASGKVELRFADAVSDTTMFNFFSNARSQKKPSCPIHALLLIKSLPGFIIPHYLCAKAFCVSLFYLFI